VPTLGGSAGCDKKSGIRTNYGIYVSGMKELSGCGCLPHYGVLRGMLKFAVSRGADYGNLDVRRKAGWVMADNA
jgi:hypothetical protein